MEALVALERDDSAREENLYLSAERVRQIHRGGVAPQLAVGAARQTIMKDDEVANLLIFANAHPVIFFLQDRIEVPAREHLDEPGNAGLNEHDARRFQRLEKAGREPQRDDVLVPELAAVTAGELEQAGIRKRLAVEVGEQSGSRVVIADEAARIDVAAADSVLERDAPLPTSLAGRRARVGREGTVMFTGDSDRAITRKPFRPVLIPGLQRPFAQQAVKASAIDEQIGVEPTAVAGGDRLDKPRFAILRDLDDVARDAFNSEPFGVAAQISGVERRVEVERIFVMLGLAAAHRRRREPVLHRKDGGK